jgi:hypothetical protein
MPRKKKGQEEKPLNFRTIQQIRDEKANKKVKEKFVDYNSDTLAARRDDIIKLVDDNAQNFEKDNIELKKEFLKALCYGNPIRTTAQMLGVSRQRIYELKKKDPVFAACVDEILSDLEFAKVTDIENELLEIKDVFSNAFIDLYNNGLFFEAATYQKEANRLAERCLDRYDQRKARAEDLLFREDDIKAPKELNVNVITQSSTPRKLPNNLTENDGD